MQRRPTRQSAADAASVSVRRSFDGFPVAWIKNRSLLDDGASDSHIN